MKHFINIKLFTCKLNGYRSKSSTLHLCFVACPVGYFGSYCGVPCVYPTFGQFCIYECNCSQSECDHIYGCKKDGKMLFLKYHQWLSKKNWFHASNIGMIRYNFKIVVK